MPVSLLLAWRYLKQISGEKNLSIMTIVCFLGLFIGAFSLSLVVAVMMGFEKETHKKLQGVHAQIIMKSGHHEIDLDKATPVLEKEFPEIAAWSPSLYKQVIIQRLDSQDISHIVALKAIDPAREAQVTIIPEKIIQPQNVSFTSLFDNNHIVIGNALATTLEVKPGDSVNLIYPESNQVKKEKISLAQTQVVISGVFKTGIEEFDTSLILGSWQLIKQLFPHDLSGTQINIQLKKDTNEEEVIHKLQNRFGFDVYSWKDLYPALVAALKLEKYTMFFILVLIALVACMNIISLLYMHIIRKRADVAILKTLGMSNRHIYQIFFLLGLLLTSIASLCGQIAAWITGMLLQKYPFITLPDTYYVTHLPVSLELSVFILIFIVLIGMSCLSIMLPLTSLKKIHIAQILRFEG